MRASSSVWWACCLLSWGPNTLSVSHPYDREFGFPLNSHITIGRILRGEEAQGEVATSGGYSFIVLDELRWVDGVCGSANIQNITTQYEQNNKHVVCTASEIHYYEQNGHWKIWQCSFEANGLCHANITLKNWHDIFHSVSLMNTKNWIE